MFEDAYKGRTEVKYKTAENRSYPYGINLSEKESWC